MKEENRNILGGLFLIALAVLVVLAGLDVFPDVPWFRTLCSILIGAFALKELVKRHFFGSIMAMCIVAWIWEEELKITEICPFPLFIAGGLLGIGLNMLIGKRKKEWINVSHNGHIYTSGDEEMGDCEYTDDGRHVYMENNFSTVSKYVNSDAFSSAEFENNFGTANIYFNNAIMAGSSARVRAENNFGEMRLYFPRTWRLHLNQEAAFGSVTVHGTPNADMDAPLVYLEAESNFGRIIIYFE